MKMSPMEKKAFDQGKKDFAAKKEISDNPYKRISLAVAWAKGYDKAHVKWLTED